MPEQAFFTRSDQYPFVRKGVPSLFFINGTESLDSTVNGAQVMSQWLVTIYHSPKDDLSQPIVWESGARYARAVYEVGRLVANAPDRPQWTPGDFFGTTFGKPATR
jgi:Zn-dependent M28 family amino/carboxypeptidase